MLPSHASAGPLCLSRPPGPVLHGSVCQRGFGNQPLSPGGAQTLRASSRSRVAGQPPAHGVAALTRPGRHGGPVPQLRMGPVADPVADRAHADCLLWLARPVAGAGGLASAQQPFAGPDVRRRDPGLFHPSRPALHDVLHPQRPHLCPGLAVLHPAREAVSGFHCHCPFLSPPGLLVLQLPFPLSADLVASPGCVHCAHGSHREYLCLRTELKGDPPQLSL